MNERNFEARARATGLSLKADDMSEVEALVRDLDRAAAAVRGPLAYALEPLSAFRLKPAER